VATFAMAMFPGLFGTAAIPYWINSRKLYYLQVSAGFFHPFVWLFTIWVVEMIFLGSMMTLFIGIAFPMIGFKSSGMALYIGLYILESFGFVGYNLMVSMFAPTTEYALAGFNVTFFFNILFGGFFIIDSHLHESSFVRAFLQWFSVQRGFYIGSIRNEQYGAPLNCSDSEKLPYDIKSLAMAALTNYTQNQTDATIVASTTLQQLQKSDPVTFNTTFTYLENVGVAYFYYGLAEQNIVRVKKLLGAGGANYPSDGYKSFLSTVMTSTTGYLAAQLNVSSVAQFTELFGYLANAYSLTQINLTLSETDVPITYVCPFNNGTDFLTNQAGLTSYDMYDQVSDSFYQGYLVILSLATFVVAFVALNVCKYQER